MPKIGEKELVTFMNLRWQNRVVRDTVCECERNAPASKSQERTIRHEKDNYLRNRYV